MRDHETKGCLCRTLELSPEEIRENPVPSCLAIHIMMEFFFLQSYKQKQQRFPPTFSGPLWGSRQFTNQTITNVQ